MTPLVLIPGMMCDARMWGRAVPDGLRLLHTLPTGHDRVAGLAAAILAAAPDRFALAGLSMGGIVAMEIVAQAPHRVSGLALLDTNPFAEREEMRAKREPQIQRALAGELADIMRDEMKPNYLAPGPNQKPILDLCLDMALSLGPEVFARQSLALRDRPDQTATLAAYRGPALVLMGEHDRLCPRDRHEAMHHLMPHSRLAIIPEAGHLPTLEQPDETQFHLANWMRDIERRQP